LAVLEAKEAKEQQWMRKLWFGFAFDEKEKRFA
jgi:hypothetical protein